MAIALDVLSYAEQEAEVSTTSTTYQDLTTCTFTLSQPQEVIIIGSGSFRMDPDTAYARLYLLVNSSIYVDQASDPLSTGEIFSWGVAFKANLPAGSNTIKLQYSTSNGAATCYAKYASLLIMRDAASETSDIPTRDDIVQFYEI